MVRREKYNARPAGADNDFYDVGIGKFLHFFERGGGGGHFVDAEQGRDGVNHGGIDEWFIALDVDDGFAIAARGGFGDAIGAAGMLGAGHFDVAKLAAERGNALVVGRHDDFGERGGFGIVRRRVGRAACPRRERAPSRKTVGAYRAGMMPMVRTAELRTSAGNFVCFSLAATMQ